jgi:hypothetical protein
MASTVIERGTLRRRTKRMPVNRAKAFCRMIVANARMQAGNPEVVIEDPRTARVVWEPQRPDTVSRLQRELQQVRAVKAEGNVRAYRWRRFGPRRWQCSSPQGRCYSVWLGDRNRPTLCTCPDWDRAHSIGLKCKHYICAEEAERRYQAHLTKEREAA